MTTQTWIVGKVKITQIIELEAGDIIQETLPQATPENIKKGHGWCQTLPTNRET